MSSFILLRLFSSGHSKEVEALRFREVVLDKAESESVISVGLLACARVAKESLMLEGMLQAEVTANWRCHSSSFGKHKLRNWSQIA